MPIHQDGTCNGLQHYAALGGDRLGAEQVNLVPSEKPMDVYSGVAEGVAQLVANDFEAGVPEAKILHGKITRKIVKQTVMTNTYGVTFIGAKQQVMNRLNEVKKEHQWTDEQVGLCAPYITRKIFESLGQFFSGARAIQLWLNKSAKMIASSVPASDLDQQALNDTKFLESIGAIKSSPSAACSLSSSTASDTDKSDPSSVTSTKEASLGNSSSESSKAAAAAEEWNDSHIVEQKPVAEQLLLSAQSEADEKPATSNTASLPVSEELDVTEKVLDLVSEQGFDSHSRQKKSSGDMLRMTSVTWTTPLGLPIVQPYRNERSKTVRVINGKKAEAITTLL
jgi:DNA-directed RNA polymerase